MPISGKIRVGDHVEITPMEKDLRTPRDFGVIRGTALDDRSLGGEASFRVQLNIDGLSEPPVLPIYLNTVQVRVLFSAGIARHMPATTSAGLPVPERRKP